MTEGEELTIRDVYEFIYNYTCGGCEYSTVDELGEGPDPTNPLCQNCHDWNKLYEDIDNLTLEEAIKKYTPYEVPKKDHDPDKQAFSHPIGF